MNFIAKNKLGTIANEYNFAYSMNHDALHPKL